MATKFIDLAKELEDTIPLLIYFFMALILFFCIFFECFGIFCKPLFVSNRNDFVLMANRPFW